jgi:hypothetical protein
MRKLEDQAATIKREVEADGSVRDAMDRRNLEESELCEFWRWWDAGRTPSIGSTKGRRGDRPSSDRRALK